MVMALCYFSLQGREELVTGSGLQGTLLTAALTCAAEISGFADTNF